MGFVVGSASARREERRRQGAVSGLGWWSAARALGAKSAGDEGRFHARGRWSAADTLDGKSAGDERGRGRRLAPGSPSTEWSLWVENRGCRLRGMTTRRRPNDPRFDLRDLCDWSVWSDRAPQRPGFRGDLSDSCEPTNSRRSDMCRRRADPWTSGPSSQTLPRPDTRVGLTGPGRAGMVSSGSDRAWLLPPTNPHPATMSTRTHLVVVSRSSTPSEPAADDGPASGTPSSLPAVLPHPASPRPTTGPRRGRPRRCQPFFHTQRACGRRRTRVDARESGTPSSLPAVLPHPASPRPTTDPRRGHPRRCRPFFHTQRARGRRRARVGDALVVASRSSTPSEPAARDARESGTPSSLPAVLASPPRRWAPPHLGWPTTLACRMLGTWTGSG